MVRLGAYRQRSARCAGEKVWNVGEPQVCQKLIAFIGLLRIGKGFTACVILYVVVSISEMDDADVIAVFRSSLGIPHGQFLGNCRPDSNVQVRWHPPKLIAFEEFR